MRQGNTLHPYLVIQLRKDLVQNIKIKMSADQIQEKYGDKLKEEYDGLLYDTLAKCFKQIVKTNVIIPDEKFFT